MINKTHRTRFIIISEEEKDLIDDEYIQFKQSLLIPELSLVDAAKILMKEAKDSTHLKQFTSAYQLSKHKIFTVFPLKPRGIVQIAMLLKNKSLDAIYEETT